jgi:hypothetical protein
MMDAALIDMLPSGATRYLRPDVLQRPAAYATAPNWPMRLVQANVIELPDYIAPAMAQKMRYLTNAEQQIFSSALRRSVKVVRAGAART